MWVYESQIVSLDYKCNKFKQRRHLKKMCTFQQIKYCDNSEVSLFAISSCKDESIKVKVFIHDQPSFMELTTGSENIAILERLL